MKIDINLLPNFGYYSLPASNLHHPENLKYVATGAVLMCGYPCDLPASFLLSWTAFSFCCAWNRFIKTEHYHVRTEGADELIES